jgi:hypothetical protein
MKRRLQWCIGLGLLTGIAALLWFGARPWAIAFALLMLVCPAAVVWVVWYARHADAATPTRARPERPASVIRKRPGG